VLPQLYTRSDRTMNQYRYRQLFLSLSCLLVICLTDIRPLLIGGLLKLLVFLLLAYLFLFAVVNSSSIGRVIATCWRVLPVLLFAFSEDRWIDPSSAGLPIPHQPSLAPLFERPPPAFSL
jgi:hypothetical protein